MKDIDFILEEIEYKEKTTGNKVQLQPIIDLYQTIPKHYAMRLVMDEIWFGEEKTIEDKEYNNTVKCYIRCKGLNENCPTYETINGKTCVWYDTIENDIVKYHLGKNNLTFNVKRLIDEYNL